MDKDKRIGWKDGLRKSGHLFLRAFGLVSGIFLGLIIFSLLISMFAPLIEETIADWGEPSAYKIVVSFDDGETANFASKEWCEAAIAKVQREYSTLLLICSED